jgi:hypothetical protein
MSKVYFSKDKAKLVFAVKVGDKVKNISFSNFGGSYTSDNEDEQKAIEKTFYFKKGLIYSLDRNKSEETEGEENPIDNENDIVEDITDIQAAKEYLISKCNVPHQSLRTPDAILKQAELNKVSFPNLKF